MSALICALVLDALCGEPRAIWTRVPHPAVLMGRAVAMLDQRWNHGNNRRAKGILTTVLLGLGAVLLGIALSWLGWLVTVLVTAILLSQKSLVDHVRAVADGLRLSTGEGRRAVAQIVGRDTAAMDDSAIARSAIESAAENFSDGVVAPVFWFAVAGLPGLMLYKITNTADSMIGYRNARYGAFGWAAARFDDVLNIVPARLTALLIAAVHGQMGHLRAIVTDARRHRSPNAGWPEAAMARVLGVALAGPRSYDGEMREFAYVNPHGTHRIGPQEIDRACRALWLSWGVMSLLLLVTGFVFG